MQTCEMIDCNVLGLGIVGFGSPNTITGHRSNQLNLMTFGRIDNHTHSHLFYDSPMYGGSTSDGHDGFELVGDGKRKYSAAT
jgi:hypothetical protein